MSTHEKVALLLDALQEVDGVLATGAFLGSHKVVHRERPDYRLADDRARTIWKSVKETFRHLRTRRLAAERLQWRFADCDLHAVYVRSTAIGLVVEKNLPAEAFDTIEDTLQAWFASDVPRRRSEQPPTVEAVTILS